jgi:hypothetical protein
LIELSQAGYKKAPKENQRTSAKSAASAVNKIKRTNDENK